MNKLTTVLISAAVIIGVYGFAQARPLSAKDTGWYTDTRMMNVNGVACLSFSACHALLKDGSIWNISGDWSSSGKLSVTKGNVSVIGNGAKLQYVTASGNNVTFKGFEVTGSPAGVNGIFWTGENGLIENINCHDSGLTCIRLYTSFNTTVQNSIVYDNLRGVAGNSDGVNCSGGGNNSFINIETYNNGDDGLDVWNCPNNIIRNSTAHDNKGAGDQNGFKLGYGGGNQVINNVAYNNGKTGFASNEGGNTFVGNLSYNNGQHGFAEWRGSRGGVQYSTYKDNVAYGNGGKNFSNSAGAYVTYISGNTTATPVTQTASSTPISPTATFTPTATKTPTPLLCPLGMVLMEDDKLVVCYKVKP